MRARQMMVIGAGRFGTAVALTLAELGHEVAVIDREEEAIAHLTDQVTHAMIADSTDEEVLRKLGVANFDTIVVAIGEDLESNILTTVALKNVGAKHVISKAKSETVARILDKVGADVVIRPEHDMGVRVAHQINAPDVLDTLRLGPSHSVMEVDIRENLVGALDELRLPNRFSVQVLTVNRGNQLIPSPSADFKLEKGDKVLLIGENKNIERFRDFLTD